MTSSGLRLGEFGGGNYYSAVELSNPPFGGFAIEQGTSVKAGTLLDRYGGPGGEFLSPAGTPFPLRGLPADQASRLLYTWRVIRDVEVRGGIVQEAYGQPGGGYQYWFNVPADRNPALQRVSP